MPINTDPPYHMVKSFFDDSPFETDEGRRSRMLNWRMKSMLNSEIQEDKEMPSPKPQDEYQAVPSLNPKPITSIEDLFTKNPTPTISEIDTTLDFLESVKKEILIQLQLVDTMIARRKAGE